MDTTSIGTHSTRAPLSRSADTAPAVHASSAGNSPPAAPADTNNAVTRPADAKDARNDKALNQAVKDFNQVLQTIAVNLNFTIDQDSGTTVVKLVDTESNTVLRQFPTEEALAISKQIQHFQEGLLIKTKA